MSATGLAPIKPEFLKPRQRAEPPEAKAPADLAAEGKASGSEQTGGSGETGRGGTKPDQGERDGKGYVLTGKRKRQRGMNKQRDFFRPDHSSKICMAVVQGRECNFGERCKFMHDLAAYYASRPDDIGPECPIYTLHGFCKYGVGCRFGSAHLSSPDGANIRRADAAEEILHGLSAAETAANVPRAELITLLRKNRYDFKRADALSKAMTADVASQQIYAPNNLRNVQPAAPEPAPGAPAAPAPDDAPASSSPDSSAAAMPAADAPSAPAAAPPVEPACGGAVAAEVPQRKREFRPVDFSGKLYLAPLTTVGNLPFRRICKGLGADITCGEMAVATNLLQGQSSEWALMRRHPCEDIFGVQLAGSSADSMGRVAQMIEEEGLNIDFVDINMGCPIDLICNKGCGSALATRPGRVQGILRTMTELLSCPVTTKIRMGYDTAKPTAHNLIPRMVAWGSSAITLHGRSRQQRYSKSADWEYIQRCSQLSPVPFIGNGDVFSFEDAERALSDAEGGGASNVSALMVARGALVKPWVFTEIKERRHWDISSGERLDILRGFVKYGLEHWGSDELGVSRTRNYLLEWLSFLYRYVPVGLLERLPGRLQDRPPAYVGRNELETLMGSPDAADWVKITEMLLGPVPASFSFTPKHKSNSYSDTGAVTVEG